MEFSFSEHIVLENESALIRPMEPEDFAGLSKIAYDYEIWRFNVSRCMNDEEIEKLYLRRLSTTKRPALSIPW